MSQSGEGWVQVDEHDKEADLVEEEVEQHESPDEDHHLDEEEGEEGDDDQVAEDEVDEEEMGECSEAESTLSGFAIQSGDKETAHKEMVLERLPFDSTGEELDRVVSEEEEDMPHDALEETSRLEKEPDPRKHCEDEWDESSDGFLASSDSTERGSSWACHLFALPVPLLSLFVVQQTTHLSDSDVVVLLMGNAAMLFLVGLSSNRWSYGVAGFAMQNLALWMLTQGLERAENAKLDLLHELKSLDKTHQVKFEDLSSEFERSLKGLTENVARYEKDIINLSGQADKLMQMRVELTKENKALQEFLTVALHKCGWWCEDTKEDMASRMGWHFHQDPLHPRIFMRETARPAPVA